MKLPKKPSALIKLALADLEKAEKDSRYIIDMDIWHLPKVEKNESSYTRTCTICLAGAVMAGTLGKHFQDDWSPENFEAEEQRALLAINHFREGDIEEGMTCLGIAMPANLPEYFEITPYEDDKGKFKKHMFHLALTLEHFDL